MYIYIHTYLYVYIYVRTYIYIQMLHIHIHLNVHRPKYIDEQEPEACSFRQQEKMRKKLNNLTVRLGLGLADVKRCVWEGG